MAFCSAAAAPPDAPGQRLGARCPNPAIAGHSLKDVETAHYLGWTNKRAVSAVYKLERAAVATGIDGEQNWKTIGPFQMRLGTSD